MKHCININHSDVTNLAQELKLPKTVVAAEIALWQESNGLDKWPSIIELKASIAKLKTVGKPENLQYQFKVVDKILSNFNKVVQWFGIKNFDFWTKLQKDLQIPKEQVALLKESEGNTIEEKLTSFIANYSYTVEINTAKTKHYGNGGNFKLNSDHYHKETYGDRGFYYKNDIIITSSEYNVALSNYIAKSEVNSQYYFQYSVPGGTNYTENEIATPDIIPSIKGHAEFATNKSIGWFRSDEQLLKKDITGYEETFDLPFANEDKVLGTPSTKTRRILEVQSDLFQKGRDKNRLVTGGFGGGKLDGTDKEFEEFLDKKFGKENQFLQLLNKDNNWVTFFIKSIIQDSAKKGYEKVLFPSGNTASKVEGHSTLEEFKKQKEDRIKELENRIASDETITDINNIPINKFEILDNKGETIGFRKLDEKWNIQYMTGKTAFREQLATDEQVLKGINKVITDRKEKDRNEINQLKQELERVETEGFGALKPIYNFYENTVTNILKKQGYNPVLITDEYGNTWQEIALKNLDKEVVNFSKSQEIQKPSDKELNKALDKFIEAAEIDVNIVKYLKNRQGLIDSSLSAEAKTVKTAKGIQKVINVVAGRDTFENRSEEVAHIFTAMLGFNNPLYQAMEKRVSSFAEYEEVKRDYPELSDDKDIRFEAIGKVLRNNLKDLVTNKSKDRTLQAWWDAVLRFISKLVGRIYNDPFKKAALDILNANIEQYDIETIQANSKLTELDDVYLSKTGKYSHQNPKKLVNKTTKKEIKNLTLNPYQVKALNQKELNKVSLYTDVSLNTSTLEEIKEVLRDNISEFAYVDAGGMSFLAEQIRTGRWKLTCSI